MSANTMLGLIILLTGCMDREGYSIQTIEKVLSNLQNQSEAEHLMDFFIAKKGKVTEQEALEKSSDHTLVKYLKDC